MRQTGAVTTETGRTTSAESRSTRGQSVAGPEPARAGVARSSWLRLCWPRFRSSSCPRKLVTFVPRLIELRERWNDMLYYVLRCNGMRSNDPSLLIMASLAEGPKHGYAITRDVQEIAGVTLGPGTLYGAIARLEESGLIEPLEADDRRRPYRLTGSGVALLRERLTEQQRVASVGLRRLSTAAAPA